MNDYAQILLDPQDIPDLRFFYSPYRFALHGTLNQAWEHFQGVFFEADIFLSDAISQID